MPSPTSSIRDLLRVPPLSERVDLADLATDGTPGLSGKHREAAAGKDVAELAPRLAELQERLYAEGKAGGTRRVVLLLQAMDAGGKDGAVKHVVGLVNPAGVRITSFGKPTEEERAHDFLWRIERAVPEPGMLGVFNRSQYEDVLVVRVHDLVPPEVWQQRYAQINAWEAAQAAQGVTFVKVFLHISADEQRERLLARLDDPTKLWKVNPADVLERQSWDAYQEAYAAVLERCSTDVAPWYAVPADHKWYRDWALAHLLVETLEALDPQWPPRPELDLDGMRAALAAG
jgi:PPK2 family polyphosphate:nucleotide phosphotransferase